MLSRIHIIVQSIAKPFPKPIWASTLLHMTVARIMKRLKFSQLDTSLLSKYLSDIFVDPLIYNRIDIKTWNPVLRTDCQSIIYTMLT